MFSSTDQNVVNSLTCSSTGGDIMHRVYSFQPNSNIGKITNCVDTNRDQNFTYDSLNRIQYAYTDGPNWGQQYTIDPWGNLTNIAPYINAGASVNLAVGINNQATGMVDAAGNQTTGSDPWGMSHSYTYDPENRISTVDTSNALYVYDGDGNRALKNVGGTGTIYWYGADGSTLAESDLTGNLTAEYVFFNGRRIARTDNPASTTGTASLKYYLTDHLGSTSMITDATFSTILEDTDYYPYGGEVFLNSSDSNHYHFTGKERDSESGNDYFGARYYASTMGRFMSPDPGPWQLENPQYLNMYNYALNNPLRYTDAEGETPQDRVLKAIQLTTQNIPYKSGGHSEATGLDCSGLVADVWKSDPDSVMNLTVNGPGGGAANEAAEFQNNGAGQWSTDIGSAQPGDAIFFANESGTIVHTGIVVDVRDGKVYFVHAPKPGEKVKPYYVKVNNPKLGSEKFAGVGRSIENAHPGSNSNSNAPSAWQRFTSWAWSLFSNQPPAEPKATVTATSCATGPDGKVTCQ